MTIIYKKHISVGRGQKVIVTLVRIRWPIFSKRPLSWNLNAFLCLCGWGMAILGSKKDVDSRSSLGFSFSCCLNCSRLTALILARERERARGKGRENQVSLQINFAKPNKWINNLTATAVVNSVHCHLKRYSEKIICDDSTSQTAGEFSSTRTRVDFNFGDLIFRVHTSKP